MRLSPINLKTLAYTLDVEGYDYTVVLKQCGFASLDELSEDGEWMPIHEFDRMMAAAIELTGDPSFGLVAGKSLALMKYGVITPIVLSSPSLRHVLDDIQRYGQLSVERAEIELVEQGQTAQLAVNPVVRDGGLSGRFRTEMVATGAVQMLRFAGANSSDIWQIDFPYAMPQGQAQRYAAAFGPNIHFDKRACVISFNPALLDGRLPSHDAVSYMSAKTRAEQALVAFQAGTDLADEVRRWLLDAFPRLPNVLETAAHLKLNERSYRRQLALLGTSHAELAQDCQRLMAERLLAEGKLPLKQVAEALGFSSVHSFHRAFRRWTGLTPSAWRDGQGDSLQGID